MTGVIGIRELVVSFGERRVLDRLTFSVPHGSMFGFVGPNGAGKTTTMRCLLEIVTPDSGELTVLGAAPSAATRRVVGYMPEERGLYPKMTAARQIAYFAQLNGAETADANARALALLARLASPTEVTSPSRSSRWVTSNASSSRSRSRTSPGF